MCYCGLFCLVTLFYLFLVLMFIRTSCDRYELSHLKWFNLIQMDSDGDQLSSSVQGSAVWFGRGFQCQFWFGGVKEASVIPD